MSAAKGIDWLIEHPDRFSLSIWDGGRHRGVGKASPVVLASTQKVFTLHLVAGFVKLEGPDKLLATTTVGELNSYYRPHTDGGAHELSLLAEGLRPSMVKERLPLKRLVVSMMYYSSNAAADAIEAQLSSWSALNGGSVSSPRPTLLADQVDAAAGGDTDPWYRGTTEDVVASLVEIDRLQSANPAFSPLSYIPQLSPSTPHVRFKGGQLPGHQAGAVVVVGKHSRAFGAFSLETGDLNAAEQERVKEALIKLVVAEHVTERTVEP